MCNDTTSVYKLLDLNTLTHLFCPIRLKRQSCPRSPRWVPMGYERGSMFPQSPYSVGEEGGGLSLASSTAAASAEEVSLSQSRISEALPSHTSIQTRWTSRIRSSINIWSSIMLEYRHHSSLTSDVYISHTPERFDK